MIDNIASLVEADAKLVRRGRFVDTTFMIAIDDAYTLTCMQKGRIIKVTPGPSSRRTLVSLCVPRAAFGKNSGSRCRRSASPTCSRW